MKLKKIDPQTAERKPCYVQDYTHEHGRSRVIVECPFCGRANIAYIWSLAGSGKRCGNDDCRAHLCYGVAIRDMVPDESRAVEIYRGGYGMFPWHTVLRRLKERRLAS